ncbi:WhiB family transcriptional regulator [Sphaerisporangium aureirubrum]|uniref:WhiB family transcriptional regulator n=1 Tax=Sphaerisporangium aureirubrum TaxID=1544736 RepID=A0ABW1NDL8_9ACTN
MRRRTPPPIVTCVCCGEEGPHGARNLRKTCYDHHKAKFALHKFPPSRQPAEPWAPSSQSALSKVQDYDRLVADGVTDPEILASRIGCSVRHVTRLASASKAPQAARERGDLPEVGKSVLRPLSVAPPHPSDLDDDTPACRGTDLAMWFPGKGGGSQDAKNTCMSCPLRGPCLDYALRYAVDGIWAGTSRKQRNEERKKLGITASPVMPSRVVPAARKHRPRPANVAFPGLAHGPFSVTVRRIPPRPAPAKTPNPLSGPSPYWPARSPRAAAAADTAERTTARLARPERTTAE